MEEASVMMVGLRRERVLQGLKILEAQAHGTLQLVSDYSMPNVSDKILRIILSYTDYVRRVVGGIIMSKRISICISTWCRKRLLEEIIHLLQDQTIHGKVDYEIIVCDSYSHDGTKEVMEELCKRYSNIRYLNTKERLGSKT